MGTGTMKPFKGLKLPAFSIITCFICASAFIILLYTERISFKLKSCNNKVASKSNRNRTTDDGLVDGLEVDDRFEFDPEECTVSDGKWVFNSSFKPLYSDRTCPYLDRQVSCVKNGRPDADYRQWEWQPDDCILPRFNPEIALKKLRGKRLMFVGDSLGRNQWQSLVCMVESIIPKNNKTMRRGHVHSVFKAEEYNATIEFYWAPFLVESNTDLHFIGNPKQRILKVDSVERHAKNWLGVDILVFNTYVWWTNGLKKINALWGSFANGEEGYEELDETVAYRIGLKTWANWVDSTIDPNKTRVFFTTMSPTHMRSVEWEHEDGIKCYNETRPVMKKGQWGSGSNKKIMKAASDVLKRMKFPVSVINITQISEYRIDGHTSVYTESGGKVLTDEQKADPLNFADCIHWCTPGIPDTWNQIFYAHL